MKAGTLIALVNCLVFLLARPGVAQTTRSGPFPLTSENVPARYGTIVPGLAPLPMAPSLVLPSAAPQRPFSRYQPQLVESPLMGLSRFASNPRANSYYRFRQEQQLNQEAQALSQMQQRRIGELARRDQFQFDGLYGSALLGETQLEVTKLRQAGTEVPDALIDKMTEQANRVLQDLEEERQRRQTRGSGL